MLRLNNDINKNFHTAWSMIILLLINRDVARAEYFSSQNNHINNLLLAWTPRDHNVPHQRYFSFRWDTRNLSGRHLIRWTQLGTSLRWRMHCIVPLSKSKTLMSLWRVVKKLHFRETMRKIYSGYFVKWEQHLKENIFFCFATLLRQCFFFNPAQERRISLKNFITDVNMY